MLASQTLGEALLQSQDFKEVVAYLTGLAKFGKPEVLPYLVAYVNGTAPNLYHVVSEGEEVLEAVYFVRKAALLSLEHVAEHFAKEVSSS